MLAIAFALLHVLQSQTVPIPVRVDPRVELVTTVFRLADAEEFRMESSDSPYARTVDKYFAPFKHHPAVELAREIRERDGIGFDAVPSLAVNLTDVETLGERIPFDLPPKRWDARWKLKDARAFVVKLKDFVRDTHYNDFVASQRSYYEHATHGFSDLLNRHDVSNWLQDFYGSRPSREPFVIVGLLCGGGNYGMSVEFPDGSIEMSPIFGASQFDSAGLPVFDESDLPTVLHEFSHGYVNPLVRKDLSILKPAAHRFQKRLGPVFASNAYGTSEAVLYESFVRASETYLVRKYLGADLAEKSLIDQRSRGFLWTSDLVDDLVAYDRSRAAFPSYATYLPHLERTFLRLARDPRAIYQRCPQIENCEMKWGPEDNDGREVSVTVRFDQPMRTQTRGVSLAPEGWKVAKKTEFAPDARSFTIVLRLKKGVLYQFALNRYGRGLVSQEGYPVLPFSRSIHSK